MQYIIFDKIKTKWKMITNNLAKKTLYMAHILVAQ